MRSIELDLEELYALVPDNARMELEWRESELKITILPVGKLCGMAMWLPIVEIRDFQLGAQFFLKAQIQMLIQSVFPAGQTITFTIPESPP